MDMEDSSYVDRTLRLVHAMHDRHAGSVRAVIQAYLYRSEQDIDRLCAAGIPVRLCKGAYQEPPDVAFTKKADVDGNYSRLLDTLLARGNHPALATHDPKMVAHALNTVRKLGMRPDRFEFQMLYGIGRDMQKRLVADGFCLRLYVPYGRAWYPYFMRRLAERPANVWFIVKNFFR
jgi:proline dehydrogenase